MGNNIILKETEGKDLGIVIQDRVTTEAHKKYLKYLGIHSRC